MSAPSFHKAAILLATLPFIGTIGSSVQAQTITPAQDGTNTVIVPNGTQFNIQGGKFSGNGANLFHSFEQFGLSEGQIANFLSSPQIQNILGRVIGGDASIINGLIQVSGGNSNLFLINPAGILFGPNARLDVPAAFTATTATAIGFGENTWFNAFGDNQWSTLVGTPNAFQFNLPHPGSIVNLGHLAVSPGQNLSLVGGSVINLGTLETPGGKVTLAAVPGEQVLRISQEGHLLSLDIPVTETHLNPLSLPALLTGNGLDHADSIRVNDRGQVVLSQSGVIIPNETGVAIASGSLNVSGTTGGEVNVLGDRVGLVSANINASGTNGGGTILIGGDYKGQGTLPNATRTFVSRDSTLNADAVTQGDGGLVVVWADDTTQFLGNITARGGLEAGNGGFVEVSGKETLNFRGSVDTSAPNGSVGTLLLDPATLTIIDRGAFEFPEAGTQDPTLTAAGSILAGDPDLGDNTVSWIAINDLGAAANVVLEATGDITIEDITGVNFPAANDVVFLQLATGSLRVISTEGSIVFEDINDRIVTEGGAITLQAPGGNITAGILHTIGAQNFTAGNVTVEAAGDITVNEIRTGGGDIVVTSANGTIDAIGTIASNDGNTTLTGNEINLNGIEAGAGILQLQPSDPNLAIRIGDAVDTGAAVLDLTSNDLEGISAGEIIIGRDDSSGAIFITNPPAFGSSLTIQSPVGAGSINSDPAGLLTTVGDLRLTANQDIITGNIINFGPIEITSNNGNIDSTAAPLTTINSNPIRLNAPNGSILTGDLISTDSLQGGGDVSLIAGDRIVTGTIDASGGIIGAGGVGGQVELQAPNEISPGDIITTNNTVSLDGPVILTNDLNITSGPDGGNVTFNGTIDSQNGTQSLTVDAGLDGILSFNGLIGEANPLGGFDVTGQELQFSGGLRTNNGDITLNLPVILTGDTEFNAGTGVIEFLNTLEAGANDLTLTTDSFIFFNTQFANSVTGTGNLLIQTASPNRNIEIGGITENDVLPVFTNNHQVALEGANFASITVGREDASGSITLVEDVTFISPVILRSPLDSINTTGFQILSNASLTLQASQISPGNISTIDDTLLLDGPVLLIEDASLSTGSIGGNLIFNSTLNGNHNLTLNAGTNGVISFNDLIGGVAPLASFDIQSGLLLEFSGGLQTNNGNINLNLPVILTGDTIFNAGTAGIEFGSTLDAGVNSLTLTADSFIDFSGGAGSVTGTGSLIVQAASPNRNIEIGGLGEADALNLFTANQNAALANSQFSQITIGQATGGDINIVGAIAFGSPVNLLSGGTINVNASISAFDSLSLAGSVILNSDINSPNADLFIRGNTTLANNSTLTAQDISFEGTINGFNALTLEASEDITVSGNIGDAVPLGNLTINNAANVTTQAITAAGLNQLAGSGTTTFNGDINLTSLNASPGISLTGTNFVFGGNVTTDNGGSFTINNSGTLTLGSNTNFNLEGSFNQTGTGAVSLGSNITTGNNDIRFSAPVTIEGEVSLNPGTGAIPEGIATRIAFGSTLEVGNNPLTLQAGEVNFTGAVTGSNTLTLIPATPTQNIILGGIEETPNFDLSATDLAALASGGGFSNITIGGTNFGGEIRVATPGAEFNDPVTLQTTGAIAVDAPLSSARGLSLNSATTALNANLSATDSPITINSNTTLGNDITIAGGILSFNGTLDGTQNLTLEAGTGDISFSDAVGSNAPLANLNINSANRVTFTRSLTATGNVTINNSDLLTIPSNAPIDLGGSWSQTGSGAVSIGSNLTANGGIQFEGFVTLTDNVSFLPGPGAIAFNSGLDAGDNPLTLTARQIDFGGPVTGSNTLLLQPAGARQNIVLGTANDPSAWELTAAEIGFLQGFSNITIGLENGANAITINADLAFTSPVTLQTGQGSITGTGNLSSNGTPIRLRAGSNIIISNIDTSNLDGPGGEILVESRTGEISTGNLNASGTTQGGAISVLTPIRITTGEINSSATLGDGGNVILDPQGDIQVEFINAQGGTEGRGGDIAIVTEQFFRALGTFIDQNGILSSISNAGGQGGGSITIRHGGGVRTPFIVVGDRETGNTLDFSRNGTRGNITAGSGPDETLAPGAYFGPFTQGPISVITSGSPRPDPDIIDPPPNIPEPNIPAPPPPEPLPPDPLPADPDMSDPPPPEPSLPDDAPVLSNAEATRLVTDLESSQTALTVEEGENAANTNLDTTEILRDRIAQALANNNIPLAISLIEQLRFDELRNYFGNSLTLNPNGAVLLQDSLTTASVELIPLEEIQATLTNLADRTGTNPAIVYLFAQPEQLHLILVSASGQPLLKTIPAARRDALMQVANTLRSEVTNPRKIDTDSYLPAAQQLYQWLIAPLAEELQARGIDTLAFSMETGLRSLPLAALHDGEQFLVENYSLGLIPSINLVDTRYQDIRNAPVLAMGASQFTNLEPLPAVPVELSIITQVLGQGKAFLNEAFTLNNLKSQRAANPFAVLHLATHAEFRPGQASNSYIQLWNEQLRLDQLRQLRLDNPVVELLVLSACRTAVGDEDAELGFGGLAIAAGVKSAIASLWYVSDEGTLALMTQLYEQLKTAPIKAEALRQAQMTLIQGQVQIENGQFRGLPAFSNNLPLPSELTNLSPANLSHPYYWASFTLIGSPW
ncbi:MAG: CHAT domain-containing protein [Desertifilum sp.]|nr:CHAT domain-containing protein [Desertifilum sp.]